MVYGNISDHIFLENIITVHGDRNIQIIGERSHDNVIVNCVGYNGGLHNFSIDGTESLVQDNSSYCDRNDNSTDYYYSVFGSDHVIRNNYSKRVGDLSHYGHGLSIHLPFLLGALGARMRQILTRPITILLMVILRSIL